MLLLVDVLQIANVARDKWLEVGRALGFNIEELEDWTKSNIQQLRSLSQFVRMQVLEVT